MNNRHRLIMRCVQTDNLRRLRNQPNVLNAVKRLCIWIKRHRWRYRSMNMRAERSRRK